jgi:hypothetical protein
MYQLFVWWQGIFEKIDKLDFNFIRIILYSYGKKIKFVQQLLMQITQN